MTNPEQYDSFQQAVTKIGKIGFLQIGRLRLDRNLKDATLLERDSATLEKARTFLPESQIEAILAAYGVPRAGKSIRIVDPRREIVQAQDAHGNEVLASPNPFQQEGMYYLPASVLLPNMAPKDAPREPVWEQSAQRAQDEQVTPPVPGPVESEGAEPQAQPTASAPITPESDVAYQPATDYAALARQTIDDPTVPAGSIPRGHAASPAPDPAPVQTIERPQDHQAYTVPPVDPPAAPPQFPMPKRITVATALIELGYGNVQADEMLDPKLDQTLLKKGRITSEQAAEAQALSRAMKYVDVAYDPPNQNVSHLLDENTSRSERVFPHSLRENGTFIVLTDVPAKEAIIRTRVAERSGQQKVEVRVVSSPTLDRLIREQYTSATALQDLNQELESNAATPEMTLDGTENVVSRFVSDIIMDAFSRGASDIHIEPTSSGLNVRFRIDGRLRLAFQEPIAASGMGNIVRVVKLMSRMDVGNNRLPQDNRISLKVGGYRLNLRVSSMPQAHGNEKLVLRILKDANQIPEIEDLGMAPATLERFKETIRKPEGLFLVTGPTGSGKSFTLYSALKRIATPERNAQTLEDPIEYEIPGLNQAQMNAEAGYTFAVGLRAAMRQDPDLLLLGEIRDEDTANISLSMANTGHQVLSTLHTISAAAAVQRLRDLGAENYNISPSLQGVMAQRLVAKLCLHCAQPAKLPKRVSSVLKGAGLEVPAAQYHEVNPQGCPKCERGRRGRLPIHELLVVSPAIRDMINKSAPVSDIEHTAMQEGMLSLALDGYLKVAQGLIGIDDLEGALNEIASDFPSPHPTSTPRTDA